MNKRQKLATKIAAAMGLPTKGLTYDFDPRPLRFEFKPKHKRPFMWPDCPVNPPVVVSRRRKADSLK